MNKAISQDDNDIRYLLALLLIVGGAAAVLVWLLRRRTETPSPPAYPLAEDLIQEPRVDARVIRHPNDALMVRWYVEAETIIVYGGPSPDEVNMDEPLAVTSDVSSVTFNKLAANERHYFKIKLVGGPRDGEVLTVAEREIPFEGGVNFRDIGGYRTTDGRYTAWGKVYRAGALGELTDDDMTRLTNVGLRTACDLRTEEEALELPDRLPESVTYLPMHIVMGGTRRRQVRTLMKYRSRMDEAMVEAYTQSGIEGNPTVFGGVIAAIAEGDRLPIAVHCTAGKDRTGTAIALLLSLLGVPDETIQADYSLSNAHFKAFEAVGARAIEPFRRFGLTTNTLQPFFTANPVVIQATLDYVRVHYGSVEGYLTTVGGVTEEQIARVREIMLVDAAAET